MSGSFKQIAVIEMYSVCTKYITIAINVDHNISKCIKLYKRRSKYYTILDAGVNFDVWGFGIVRRFGVFNTCLKNSSLNGVSNKVLTAR